MEVTQGSLLGGRVHYAQPRDGFRTGIEPVLLAASVPARAGQVVLEAGTGAGAGLMCLATRVPGIVGLGVELDPEMAALARDNVAANGLDGLSIVTADVTRWAVPPLDHAMANPPWHGAASTASPVGRRRLAKQEDGDGIERWVAAIARAIREGGSLTMIVTPGLTARVAVAGAAAGLGAARRLALRPKAGLEPKLVIVQAWRGRPGGEDGSVILHEESGAFSAGIEAVLRGGGALAWR